MWILADPAVRRGANSFLKFSFFQHRDKSETVLCWSSRFFFCTMWNDFLWMLPDAKKKHVSIIIWVNESGASQVVLLVRISDLLSKVWSNRLIFSMVTWPILMSANSGCQSVDSTQPSDFLPDCKTVIWSSYRVLSFFRVFLNCHNRHSASCFEMVLLCNFMELSRIITNDFSSLRIGPICWWKHTLHILLHSALNITELAVFLNYYRKIWVPQKLYHQDIFTLQYFFFLIW